MCVHGVNVDVVGLSLPLLVEVQFVVYVISALFIWQGTAPISLTTPT